MKSDPLKPWAEAVGDAPGSLDASSIDQPGEEPGASATPSASGLSRPASSVSFSGVDSKAVQGSEPTQLEYAVKPGSSSRWVRRISAGILIVATMAIVVLISPRAFHKWRMLSLQKQCLEYTAHSDQIVFDMRTSSLPSLHRSDSSFVQGIVQASARKQFVGRVPAEWRNYLAHLVYDPGLSSMGTAFLHRRCSPAGHERLVAIDIEDGGKLSAGWSVRVIVPGSLRASPPQETIYTIPWLRLDARLLQNAELTSGFAVVAGQPDPIQLDHFTIQVISESHLDIIDGWLRDDDTVVLEMRRPSNLTPSAPPSSASSRSTDQSPPPAPLPAGR